jgi:DNA-directed RNA polymerase specialized sigma24 family protein
LRKKFENSRRPARIYSYSAEKERADDDGSFLYGTVLKDSCDLAVLIIHRDLIEHVQAVAMTSLNEKSQRLFDQHFIYDLSYEELSKELEIPMGTIKCYISRIKKVLQEKFGQQPKNGILTPHLSTVQVKRKRRGRQLAPPEALAA